LARYPWMAALLCLTMSLSPVSSGAVTLDEAARQLEAMTWYSEDYPPFNYEADGEAAGIAVDILMVAFEKIGVDLKPRDIKIVPWNRGYNFIRNRAGTALFSMTYTPERERIMKFVGPALPSRVSIIALKERKLTVDNPADLEGLTIGVVREDVGDLLLQKIVPANAVISRRNTLKQLLYLLTTGRVDAVSYSINVLNNAVRLTGGTPGAFEELLVLREAQLGYAFHNDTDPAVLAPLQKAVDELKADGTIDKIVARYGN